MITSNFVYARFEKTYNCHKSKINRPIEMETWTRQDKYNFGYKRIKHIFENSGFVKYFLQFCIIKDILFQADIQTDIQKKKYSLRRKKYKPSKLKETYSHDGEEDLVYNLFIIKPSL